MPAPVSRQIWPDLTRPGKVTRYIDNHYHLEMIAENQRQLVEYQAAALELHHQEAIAKLRALGEIDQRLDQTNSLLSAIAGGTEQLIEGVDQLNVGIDALNTSAREMIDLLHVQVDVLRTGFEAIAMHMIEQQRVLSEISNKLRAPYETAALELLGEADKALKNGMKTSGRNQEEEYKDASRLLGSILDNPIGRRNYVAWFQTGWLKWKFEENHVDAEEAFYQAARLSRSTADLYHVYSQRHVAYMQYLQGRFADAHSSIQDALQLMPNDHDTLYDSARYAAKIDREQEALELLNRCIDIQPQTIITMFSEEDFVA